jgi:hypothetical protein
MLQQVPAATTLIGYAQREAPLCQSRGDLQTTWKNRLEMGSAMNAQ